ncbi:MAG: replicative DNA helicase [Oscillospiraceae bacterium]|nr:replicative DNA helicase [Oscillospiraceae bacterium]MBR4194597.1 replicative DNA helicase [Oscillospiraceae bacterium]
MADFDDLLNKQLPQSLEAEQSVLGSMLIDSRCVGDVVGILKPEDFYLRQNQEIYETIYRMFSYSLPIDVVTVLGKLKENGYYDEAATPGYIRQLMEITPTAANVKHYANIVRDKALLRALSKTAVDINEMALKEEGTASAILDNAERKVFGLRRGNADDELERIGTIMVKLFSHLNELSQSDSDFPGAPTGLRDLDKKINGLNPSDLVIIAARPGMGKTTLALNIMMNVAKTTKKTVAFFSLEMSREQLASRLLSCESSVDSYRLSTGKLEPEDWEKIGVASAALAQTDIRVSDNPTITVTEMNALCRRLDNLGLIIVDYLQLMTRADKDSRSAENRVNVVAEISRALKIMAKDLNVPVICLSQLSRAAEGRTDKRPLLSDLRESGAIEQDADQVIMLYRDDYYNPNTAERNICECIVAKNRRGEPGTVKVQWMPQFFSFSDLDTIHGE